MKTKQKLYTLVACILSGLLYFNVAKADVIFPQTIVNPFITAVIGLAFTLFIELLVAVNIFKSDKNKIKAVLFANLISYLIFILTQIFRSTPFNDLGFGILILEPIIILLESFIIKIYLKESITYIKALKLSFILNIASICAIIIYFIILMVIGAINKVPSYAE